MASILGTNFLTKSIFELTPSRVAQLVAFCIQIESKTNLMVKDRDKSRDAHIPRKNVLLVRNLANYFDLKLTLEPKYYVMLSFT